MTRFHCSARSAGKTASSCRPALLTTIWIAPAAEQPVAGGARRGAIGDVEGDRFGAAAGGDDARRSPSAASSRVWAWTIDVGAVAAETLGDRPADAAARAGDEGAALCRRCAHRASSCVGVCRTTASRPVGDLAAAVVDREGVEQVRRVAGLAHGDDAQLVRAVGGRQVVEPKDGEPDVARADQRARRRLPTEALCGQCTVQRRRLRRIFDRGAGEQAALRPQRMAMARDGRQRRTRLPTGSSQNSSPSP